MGELLLSFFIFLTVMIIASLIFGVWAIVVVIKGIVRLFGRGYGTPQLRTHAQPVAHCMRPGCYAVNPVGARFCRRCGQPLGYQQVQARHAAVW